MCACEPRGKMSCIAVKDCPPVARDAGEWEKRTSPEVSADTSTSKGRTE